MAGSTSLSMQTQFNVLGKPLSGGKIKWIQAGTTDTPQNAYYDADLTLPIANPYTLLADGRIPAHYLADGQIKVRITDVNGVTQLEQDNIMVVGPSSGGGGGGGGVDPTTVFATGDCLWLDTAGARTGWVRDNGRSIGNGTSSATERANPDTSALFAFLWNNFSNTVCPVSTGRGVSAAADFAASKNITLPDKRGYIPGGLDDMGNSAAGRYANVPVVSGDVLTAGSVVGEATHTLSVTEIPAHTHANTLNESPHSHTFSGFNSAVPAGAGGFSAATNGVTLTTSSVSTGITITNASIGGGGAHNNVQKTVLGSFYRKL